MMADSVLNPELQYGAFGLCVMLVGLVVLLQVRSEGERKELGRRLDTKDKEIKAEIEAKNQSIVDLTIKTTTALNRLTEALEVRPCLMGDRVFRQTIINEGEVHQCKK